MYDAAGAAAAAALRPVGAGGARLIIAGGLRQAKTAETAAETGIKTAANRTPKESRRPQRDEEGDDWRAEYQPQKHVAAGTLPGPGRLQCQRCWQNPLPMPLWLTSLARVFGSRCDVRHTPSSLKLKSSV